MTNEERIQAVEDRIDTILEQATDNPIYEDHASRSLLNYLQALRILNDMRKEEQYGEYNRTHG